MRGMTEAAAREAYGDVVVVHANFNEIARGHISDNAEGLLKLVVSPDRVVRGVHIVGAQATDLSHIAQMGLINDATVDVYIENVFNFPTYYEGYRVVALQTAAKLARSAPAAGEMVA